jgi:hypothetical protein
MRVPASAASCLVSPLSDVRALCSWGDITSTFDDDDARLCNHVDRVWAKSERYKMWNLRFPHLASPCAEIVPFRMTLQLPSSVQSQKVCVTQQTGCENV